MLSQSVTGTPQQLWRRRSAEWSLLIALILVLVAFFAREIKEVQAGQRGLRSSQPWVRCGWLLWSHR